MIEVVQTGNAMSNLSTESIQTPPLPVTTGTCVAGPLRVDLDRREVAVMGANVPLSATEFELLVALLDARGRILTRAHLLDRMGSAVDARNLNRQTVDVKIARLRRKLGISGRFIMTERGSGYRFAICPEWIAAGQDQQAGADA